MAAVTTVSRMNFGSNTDAQINGKWGARRGDRKARQV